MTSRRIMRYLYSVSVSSHMWYRIWYRCHRRYRPNTICDSCWDIGWRRWWTVLARKFFVCQSKNCCGCLRTVFAGCCTAVQCSRWRSENFLLRMQRHVVDACVLRTLESVQSLTSLPRFLTSPRYVTFLYYYTCIYNTRTFSSGTESVGSSNTARSVIRKYDILFYSWIHECAVVVVISGMQLLRLHSAIRRHHPPQRAVLSQICCFAEYKVVLFQILLDGAEPLYAGTT